MFAQPNAIRHDWTSEFKMRNGRWEALGAELQEEVGAK